MKLFAVHDKKAKSLSSFHVLAGVVVASRSFAEAVLDPQSPYGKYPQDFELVFLCDVSQEYEGQFDEVQFVSEVMQQSVVITAEQVLASQPKADAQIPLRLEANG